MMGKRRKQKRPVQNRRRGRHGLTSKKGRPKKRPQSRIRRQRGGSFLNKLINKLPLELHLPGHRFTGPGTKLEKRLDRNDRPLPHSKPINRVDETSMYHDICYRDNKSSKGRTKCDKDMLNRLGNIKNPTLRERLDRFVVRPIIGIKHKLRI